MLTPSARVSVANTTCINPREKSTSTSCLSTGRSPAWWNPMPLRASAVSDLHLIELDDLLAASLPDR